MSFSHVEKQAVQSVQLSCAIYWFGHASFVRYSNRRDRKPFGGRRPNSEASPPRPGCSAHFFFGCAACAVVIADSAQPRTGVAQRHLRFLFGRVACAPVIAHSPEPGNRNNICFFWLRCVRLRGWAQRIAMNRRRAATFAATCGRPSQELAGGQPNIWRRFGEELAGGQPKNWRATNPRTDGRPTQELASDNSAGMRLAWTPHNSPRLWAESR